VSTLSDDRRRAIEQSGWGEEFRLVQPHNLAFWVYCVLVVAGAVVVSGQISIAAAAYSGALISGIVAFGLLAVGYLWFIHYEDRYTTVPPELAAAGFVWGGVAAIGAFALLGNDAVMSLYAKTFGASFAFDWGAALTAPIDEELAKGAGILLLVTLAPQLIRSPFDGLILGAFVGLGFQISEDISYAFIGAADAFGDVGAAWTTIVVRILASIPSHWMYSGVFGAGLIWFIGRPDVPARKGLGLGLMLTAMLMHGLWDASGAIGPLVPPLVAAGIISVFVWVYRTTVPIEREWMRELMAPEVELGVITPAELDALAGSRSTLRGYVRSQPSRRTAEHVLEAGTDLAQQLARDDGADTAAVQGARAAVARARSG
jgi:RsiW-degrading membrane proteinase PrsW (M82 family)